VAWDAGVRYEVGNRPDDDGPLNMVHRPRLFTVPERGQAISRVGRKEPGFFYTYEQALHRIDQPLPCFAEDFLCDFILATPGMIESSGTQAHSKYKTTEGEW
jgi:hypothetical protein